MPGSGLGLAIVKQVVDGHNGTVTLANRPGGGTIVQVRLPVQSRPSDSVPYVEAQLTDQPVA